LDDGEPDGCIGEEFHKPSRVHVCALNVSKFGFQSFR
jgi:hypothetical protein